MLHTWSWVAWLVAASVPAFVLRNPFYLVLILGSAWLNYSALGRGTPIGSSWGSFVKFGLFLFALTIPFNALSVHAGEIVLFRLPQGWPIVGGAVTLEAVLAGAVNGLSLMTILVVFAAFNAIVDHYQLLRAIPAFLFQAGVVISIAITFVPQMVLSAKEIRQAQRIRGHRFRGIRDLLPLVLPLLANGLERAIQLAETMEARGFGSAVRPLSHREAILSQTGTLAGLLVLLGGLFAGTFYPETGNWGWGLVGLGALGLVTIFLLQSRRVHRSRYRRPRWLARDTVSAIASGAVLAAVLFARTTAPSTLHYTPYPPNSLLPPFDPLVGSAMILLALPALLAATGEKTGSVSTEHQL